MFRYGAPARTPPSVRKNNLWTRSVLGTHRPIPSQKKAMREGRSGKSTQTIHCRCINSEIHTVVGETDIVTLSREEREDCATGSVPQPSGAPFSCHQNIASSARREGVVCNRVSPPTQRNTIHLPTLQIKRRKPKTKGSNGGAGSPGHGSECKRLKPTTGVQNER